ncbi:hypothetical protein B7463_g942, partial [Scytalidium lignicola]
MLAKSLLASAAVFASLGNAATIPVRSVERTAPADSPAMIRRDDGTVLKPLPPSNNAATGLLIQKSATNVTLNTQEEFTWGNENVIGSMTYKVAEASRRVLYLSRFSDLVKSVNCPSSGPQIQFKDSNSVQEAQQAWGWLNSPSRSIVFVVDDDGCSGPDGRQPYIVSNIAYDTDSNSATMTAETGEWQDHIDDGVLRFTNAPANPTLDKRLSIDKGGSFDISKNFSGTILPPTQFDGVTVQVDCADCETTGGFDYDFSVSFSGGVSGQLTATNSLGVKFGLQVTADGSLTSAKTETLEIAQFPLSEFSIPHVGGITPEITVNGQISLENLSAKFTSLFGVGVVIPDGSTLSIGGDSSFSPSFSQIGPTIDGSVSVEVTLDPLTTFDISASFFTKSVSIGFGLKAPLIDAKIAASTDGAICSGTPGVSIDVGAGFELDVFGGIGAAKNEPNAKSLKAASVDVFSKCIPFDDNSGSSGTSTTGSASTITYATLCTDPDLGGQCIALNGTNSVCIDLTDFNDQIGSIQQEADTECSFFTDFGCAGNEPIKSATGTGVINPLGGDFHALSSASCVNSNKFATLCSDHDLGGQCVDLVGPENACLNLDNFNDQIGSIQQVQGVECSFWTDFGCQGNEPIISATGTGTINPEGNDINSFSSAQCSSGH